MSRPSNRIRIIGYIGQTDIQKVIPAAMYLSYAALLNVVIFWGSLRLYPPFWFHRFFVLQS
jgi:hypothetical protein